MTTALLHKLLALALALGMICGFVPATSLQIKPEEAVSASAAADGAAVSATETEQVIYSAGWPEGQEEGFIPVDGGSVFYHFYGKDEPGIPIIFLHGGPGGTGECFINQTALAEDHPVVIYNQLGSTGSDFSEDITTANQAQEYLTIDHFVNEVQTVVDYFDFDEFVIVGHSWGTMLAVEYTAAKQPEGLRGLVLAGPCLNADIWCNDAERLIKSLEGGDEYWDIIQECETSGDYYSDERYMQIFDIYASNYYYRTPDAYSNMPQDPASSHTIPDLSIYEYMWGPSEFTCTGTLKGHDSTVLLKDITVPVLYLCGEYDTGTPEAAMYYNALTPNGEVCVLPGSSHNSIIEAPVEFNAAVSAFADGVSAK